MWKYSLKFKNAFAYMKGEEIHIIFTLQLHSSIS
jgi:hypothetical protein